MTSVATRPVSQQEEDMDAITDFNGEYRFLSNFAHSPFSWNGVYADTVEHHYNAAKTLDPIDRASVYSASTPGRAKRAGRKVMLRPDWGQRIKFEVMAELLERKFEDPELAQALIDTYPAQLVEGNSWHDQCWGDCTCPDHADTPGDNYLGQMLMALREDLMEERGLLG